MALPASGAPPISNTTTKKTATKKPPRMAREPQVKPASTQEASEQPSDGSNSTPPTPETAKPPTKSAVVIGLLTRSEGATLQQMIHATSWLPHTTRAALTGLKKKGFTITSEKIDGVRTYRAINKIERVSQ